MDWSLFIVGAVILAFIIWWSRPRRVAPSSKVDKERNDFQQPSSTNWIERLAEADRPGAAQGDAAPFQGGISGLADLERSMAILGVEKKRREQDAEEANARMLREQEESRAISRQHWSEYSGMIVSAVERVGDALEKHDDVHLEEPKLHLDKEHDCYEGVSGLYVGDLGRVVS